MVRTVDPQRHAARRLEIMDAALTRFAEDGYDGTTTASICRTAGIGSGTLFHYFPTKIDVLLAILELGTARTAEWFAAQRGRTDAAQVIRDWVSHNVAEFTDRRLAGFVRAVGAVMSEPAVTQALSVDETTQREGLARWIARAQQAGAVRQDLSAARLSTWVFLVLDGFIARIAADPAFDAGAEGNVLSDTVDRMLA